MEMAERGQTLPIWAEAVRSLESGEALPFDLAESSRAWQAIHELAEDYASSGAFPNAWMEDLVGIAMIALGGIHGTVRQGMWTEWMERKKAESILRARYGWLPSLGDPHIRL